MSQVRIDRAEPGACVFGRACVCQRGAVCPVELRRDLGHFGAMAFPRNEQSPPMHIWSHKVEADEMAVVLPDGCLDIVVRTCTKTGQATVLATRWDLAPRSVSLCAGISVTGYRLRPGTTVALRDLSHEISDLSGLEAEIGHITKDDHEVSEIIDALGLPDSSVYGLARQQGGSERTLQRHFKALSLPSPKFWRQLGRARRAVQALPCRAPLSDIALAYGYSDQAHMTREFVRWFGATPVQLGQDPDAMRNLAQPGLGNWSQGVDLGAVGLF